MTIDPDNPYQLGQTGQATFPHIGSPGGIAVDGTSLNSGKYLLTLTLNSVLDLLVGMIKSMQSVAVAQSNRLTFLTNWQNAYSTQMSGVHSFSTNNGDAYISTTSTTFTNTRQDLNTTNSTYTQQMRSNNNLVADAAKSLQTNISATQDAVNQQSNMATSILQQMNSIVTAIYQTSSS